MVHIAAISVYLLDSLFISELLPHIWRCIKQDVQLPGPLVNEMNIPQVSGLDPCKRAASYKLFSAMRVSIGFFSREADSDEVCFN